MKKTVRWTIQWKTNTGLPQVTITEKFSREDSAKLSSSSYKGNLLEFAADRVREWELSGKVRIERDNTIGIYPYDNIACVIITIKEEKDGE